jgi:hypothetical protein
MYFDRYSITSLRYIDISFKNFMAGNLAAGLYIVEPQFRKVFFVFSVFRSFQSCFVYLSDIRRSGLFFPSFRLGVQR